MPSTLIEIQKLIKEGFVKIMCDVQAMVVRDRLDISALTRKEEKMLVDYLLAATISEIYADLTVASKEQMEDIFSKIKKKETA